MWNDATRMWIVGGVWLTTITAVVGGSVAMGARLSTSALLLVVGLAPAVVMMLIGGAPSPTVAEILHAANAKDGRR